MENLSTPTALTNFTKACTPGMARDKPLSYHRGLMALAILVFLSNLVAIFIYLRHKTIRANSANQLLLSLAVSDLIVGILVLPVLIVCEKNYSQFASNKALVRTCHCHYLVGNFFGFSTIFHIIALTLNEYLAVMYPFRSINVSTRGTFRKILISIWSTALFFSLIPIFWIFRDEDQRTWRRKFRYYGILQMVVCFAVPLLILTYCYCRMFFKIHGKLTETCLQGRVQLSRFRNNRKTVLVLLLFFVVFVITWFPFYFLALDKDFGVPLEVRDFLVTLRFCGSFLNPFIYAFLKNDYKQAISLDLAKLCLRLPKQLQCVELRSLAKTSRSNTIIRVQGEP